MGAQPVLPMSLRVDLLQPSKLLRLREDHVALEMWSLLVLLAGALLELQHHIPRLGRRGMCPEGICRSLGAAVYGTCKKKLKLIFAKKCPRVEPVTTGLFRVKHQSRLRGASAAIFRPYHVVATE